MEETQCCLFVLFHCVFIKKNNNITTHSSFSLHSERNSDALQVPHKYETFFFGSSSSKKAYYSIMRSNLAAALYVSMYVALTNVLVICLVKANSAPASRTIIVAPKESYLLQKEGSFCIQRHEYIFWGWLFLRNVIMQIQRWIKWGCFVGGDHVSPHLHTHLYWCDI